MWGRERVYRWHRTLVILMAGLGTLLALFSLHYLRPGMPDGFVQQLQVYRDHAPWMRLHVVGGAAALLVGPWQLLLTPGRGHNWSHRAMGLLYVTGVLAGGVGGLYMARLAFGGSGVVLSFTILGVLWIGTTAVALYAIATGRRAMHRHWMLRSLALTCAAITLRLWLVLLEPLLGFETAYRAAAWLCWVPNLIVVEWWMRRRSYGFLFSALRE